MPAQALVEYGLAAAAAGNAGASSKGAASGIAGALSNLGKAMDAAQSAAVAGSGAMVAAAPVGVKPAVVYEDPSEISPKLARADLLRRFGAPSMCITVGPGHETLSYESKDGAYEVDVREGVVAGVKAKRKPKESAVVRLD